MRALPPDPVSIDALTNLVTSLPDDSSALEEVFMWNHGAGYYLGFPWHTLDETLSEPRFNRFARFSVTVRGPNNGLKLLPRLSAAGKVTVDETDSDHGCGTIYGTVLLQD